MLKSTDLLRFPNPNFPEAVAVNYLLSFFFQDNSKSKALFNLVFKVASPTLAEAPKVADNLLD